MATLFRLRLQLEEGMVGIPNVESCPYTNISVHFRLLAGCWDMSPFFPVTSVFIWRSRLRLQSELIRMMVEILSTVYLHH
jgi:hypothetical protein